MNTSRKPRQRFEGAAANDCQLYTTRADYADLFKQGICSVRVVTDFYRMPTRVTTRTPHRYSGAGKLEAALKKALLVCRGNLCAVIRLGGVDNHATRLVLDLQFIEGFPVSSGTTKDAREALCPARSVGLADIVEESQMFLNSHRSSGHRK